MCKKLPTLLIGPEKGLLVLSFLDLRRSDVASSEIFLSLYFCLSKSLQPLAPRDELFKYAPPLLFGLEFVK